MIKETKRMAPDGSYSAHYLPDGGEGETFIHAYHGRAEEGKKRFLNDARALLKAVGEELRAHGFNDQEVSVNRSGIASSGEAYGRYRHPYHDRHIFLTVDTTAMRVPLAEPAEPGQPLNTWLALTTRRDGIVLCGHWTEPPRRKGYADEMGPNVYFDPNTDSREIAAASLCLVDFVLLHPPERERTQASLLDLLAA